ncbi:MAG: hypothetical protein ACOY94_04400 [Bacillota bacterium]
MLFVGLAAVLALWSWRVLRDRPIRKYATFYVLTAAGGCVAECSVLGIWYPFETHLYVLRDPYSDLFLTEIVAKLILMPLIGCLYVRYSGQHPIRTAIVGALLLGMVELGFVATGAVIYQGWNTLFTILLFFGLFVVLNWFQNRPAPLWLQTGAVSFATGYSTHQLARIFPLWEHAFPLPYYSTDSLFLIAQNGLVAGPSALAVALIPRLRNPVGVLAAVGLNVLVDEWLRAAGILIYTGWNPWLGGLRYLLVIGITLAYSQWQMEERTGPIQVSH